MRNQTQNKKRKNIFVSVLFISQYPPLKPYQNNIPIMSLLKRKIPLDEIEDFIAEEEEEGEQNDDGSYEEDNEFVGPSGTATPLDESEIQHVVNQVVRLFLSRELNGRTTRPDVIRKHIKHNLGRKITTEKLIQQANIILTEVYGLKIEEVPTIKREDKKSLKSRKVTSDKNPSIVTSSLLSKSRAILGELWNKNLAKNVKKIDIGGNKFFLPKYSITSVPGSHYELVKTGIMLVIISHIILNENHVSESALLKTLHKFGISSNLNVKNSNFNLNSQELLKELVNKDYILKNVIKGRTELENIFDYSIGQRSLVEFSPQGVFDYIKVIYGNKFDSTIAERALVTIERAYGVALNNTEENNEREGSTEANSQEGSE